MIDMTLTRRYYDVKDVKFGERCAFEGGVLTVSKEELRALTADLCKAVKRVDFDITVPGENARIIHVLDAIQPMVKVEGEGVQYSGFFSTPYTVGRGKTNLLRGFAVLESAALPWDQANASSGLLYPGTPSSSCAAPTRSTPRSPRRATWSSSTSSTRANPPSSTTTTSGSSA